MKVLFVISSLSLRHGGPPKACLETAESLNELGHSVVICTTEDLQNEDLSILSDLQNKGISIQIFPITWSKFFLTRYFYFSLALARFLKKNIRQFDIVYIYSLYRFPPTISSFYSRKNKIPYITHPHGSLDPYLYKKNSWIKSIYEKFIEFKNLNKAAAIHFTTHEERDLVKPLKLKSRAIVIPYGIRLRDYIPNPQLAEKWFPKLKEKKVLLFLSRINFKKGLDLLVPAFAQILKDIPDLWLVLAGPDNEDYGEKVRGWLKEYKIEDKALFTGMLLGEKKRAILSLADLFVLPSYTESFGIAVIEAMAMERAVVISDKVNIWREVQEAGAGLVVPCRVDEIARACVTLLKDPQLALEMGRRGRMFVEARYSLEATTRELEKEFQKIIEEQRGAS
ncbi:glycosyltransferase [Candidatus Methylacidiphilum infernorum]|uniref:Glycosyltransferase n=1 Tax=Candidatus Methylacidiphilum infernorum TaxID=511746 RepID=A0ABX7PUQ7_9BACT|nr:glycosyltransferase [Candidatus Methylacidiphilum infernorum]QSR86408.1 glycosyltransferase [Candidatus Methylacidiphilum infernorum]